MLPVVSKWFLTANANREHYHGARPRGLANGLVGNQRDLCVQQRPGRDLGRKNYSEYKHKLEPVVQKGCTGWSIAGLHACTRVFMMNF